MGKGSVGVSTSTIIYTKNKYRKQKDNLKKKNAKVCLNCESNKEGWCEKYKGWCNRVNYICNGEEMSFQEKQHLEFCKREEKRNRKLKVNNKKNNKKL